MKKLIILIAGVLTLSSCGTTGSGAFSGAMFGGIIGSAIGGIAGGPRGSDVGTLIGMATGAATGAAMGAASERAQQTQEPEYYDKTGSGNDVIYMDPADAPNTVPTATVESVCDKHAIDIRNVRFTGKTSEKHIGKGETVSICFEIHNTCNEAISNIVPIVQETTGNKRLTVSPAILVESLGAHRAIRYTAYITAKSSLKTGTAHFKVYVNNGNTTISNTSEIDVQLN